MKGKKLNLSHRKSLDIYGTKEEINEVLEFIKIRHTLKEIKSDPPYPELKPLDEFTIFVSSEGRTITALVKEEDVD